LNKTIRVISGHKKQILWLSLVWGLVIVVFLYLGQMDLMRHIFVTVCHEIGDIWTVGFGFPLWNPWNPTWDLPIQVAFDYSYTIIGVSAFALAMISSYHIIGRKRKKKVRRKR